MAFSPGLHRPLRVLPPRPPWSRGALACSSVFHVLVFALAGFATRDVVQRPATLPVLHTSRAHALQLLVLQRPNIRPEPRPERRSPSRPDPVIPVAVPASPSSTTPDLGSISEPAESRLQVHELSPGQVTGIGQVIATPASTASPGRGLLGALGFRGPGPDEIGPESRGLDKVAELVTGAGSACPELRTPIAWANRDLAISVAFIVDTNGMVDRTTLRVVESPDRPGGEQRYQSHIYVVGAVVRPDTNGVDPAGYDSVLTREVAGHVADLIFRPALKEGRTVRSTVLISCQRSRPG
jgi:hypothetical protein